ncbi:MAG: hypothetical protein JXB62_12725 [Pirellulales bacterium]|nr:hypothetical protein [Pirellulales bacterium]
MLHDWHQFHLDEAATPAVVDPRRRLRLCLAGFLVLLLVVFSRLVQLEVTQGSAFRAKATEPLKRERSLPGVRGRILAHDGTVLACDREIPALAVMYRYLQQPPDPRWLRTMVRRRLSSAQRKDPERVAAEEDRLRQQRNDLAQRLARLCGLSADEWARRAARVQSRVERIAQSVRRRRRADLTVAEELDYHVMVENVPLAVVAEIEGLREQYPGVKILTRSRRAYPSGSLAAHVLGHLGPVAGDRLDQPEADYDADELVGKTGLERQYESLLRGRRGVVVELTDHGGRILSTYHRLEPGAGRDLVLTLSPPLQRAAESLLEAAVQRRALRRPDDEPAGGAVVVIDVHSGAVRAAASAPRFDPNVFVSGKAEDRAALLGDEAHPLFDRAVRMAIPPGSVFKVVSAVALLEAAAVDPDEPFFCQGYLHQPDRQRCAIYRRTGTGHGEVTLSDALAQSCNVYFFHHVDALGPEPLAGWASRFGFGRTTGVDLPSEADGNLPQPATIQQTAGHRWRPGDTQSLAVGQGGLTATPLQVVRMMAAIANGGRLVTPHLVSGLALPQRAEDAATAEDDADDPIRIAPPRPIPDLGGETIEAIRQGLLRVVCDPQGTAHATVYLEGVSVAGKTGTAETGGGRGDHAWFAGYVPAEKPRWAMVVALEHAGDAATAAGPVAKRLVLHMQQLGMLP